MVANASKPVRSARSTARSKGVSTKPCESDIRLAGLERELKSARYALNHLLDSDTQAIRIINQDSTIRYINRAFADMSGINPGDAAGKKCWEVFPSSLCHTPDCRLSRILGGEKTVHVEIERKKQGGATIPCVVTASPLTDETGQLTGVIEQFSDITERQQMEEQIKDSADSETRYAFLFENAPVCLLELDFSLVKLHLDELRKQGVTDLQDYFNQHPDAVLDCSRLAKVISMNKAYRDLFKAEEMAVFNEYFPQPLKNSSLNRKAIGDDYARLYRGVTLFAKEESVHNLKRQIQRVVTSIFIPPGYENSWSRLLMSLFDITELKQKEKKLNVSESRIRLLSKRTLRAQEEERSNISRELHDQLGQELVIIRRKAQSLAEESQGEPARKKTEELVFLSDKLLDSVQDLSIKLRPLMLDELGLEKAIQWYLKDFERSNGICCILRSDIGTKEEIIGKDIAVSAYRIFQEAMSNILRHSKAKTVNIGLSTRKGNLIISIKDDGIGYDSDELHDRTSLGLLGMKERASMVGGYVRLSGNPGKGARVTAYFPLAQSRG